MGAVYRAIDRRTGEAVAIKALHRQDVTAGGRFEREATVLSELEHPGIVRYVAHGRTPENEAYLVIEWLDGQDLAERLRGPRLSIAESVGLVRRVAEALAVAHARGILHRDIKPSNLYLQGGRLEGIKVLDFGIARFEGQNSATRTGVALGTPGYMAPEQARGERELDARADVFALGCVLFECLTGRPVFQGEHVMAILAKVLLEEAPRVRALRPDIPADLDDLVARMLAKRPAGRPADCVALAEELSAVGQAEALARPEAREADVALGVGEQRLVSVVLTGGGADAVGAPAAARSSEALAATLADGPHGSAAHDAVAQIQEELGRFGARVERLLDGSMVATLACSGTATDQAAQAARFALGVRALLPSIPLALATGRGWTHESGMPGGEVIDRAARLLRMGEEPVTITDLDPSARPSLRPLRLAANASAFAPKFALGGGMSISAAAKASPIRVDEVTAGLLDARFEVTTDKHGLVLHAEREQAEASRSVLGRETPCVGRERELQVLLGILDECTSEPVARAVLITGAAGVGKSRLRQELFRKVSERGSKVEIWTGRGDPMSAGAPFAMIAPALRRSAGIFDGEPLGVRRHKLRARVGRTLSGAQQDRVSELLGELIGVPFPADESPRLAAARRDAQLLGEEVKVAFEDFLAAECQAQPVILVLEDLHFGDLPSVQLIDGALRSLGDKPFFVVALARPEVRELFPRLWEERAVYELRLGELTKKSSERLARAVLGDGAAASVVDRIVGQAAGNPFYLEELVKAVVEGKGEALPETVLAMVEARLERVDSDVRRVLRAGSVFGSAFTREGVIALLRGGPPVDVDAALGRLCEIEILQRRASTKVAGQSELVFRTALVREAAYAMLPPADRAIGHRLAAEWLERSGDASPLALVDHLEKGQDPARAASMLQRAAAQALSEGDLPAALARAERGLAGGASGEPFGELWLVQAEALNWQGDSAAAAHAAHTALDHVRPGSAAYWSAIGQLGAALGERGETEALARVIEGALALPRAPDERSDELAPLHRATAALAHAGRYGLAARSLERAGDPSGASARTHIELALLCHARSAWASSTGDVGGSRREAQRSLERAEAAGDKRLACLERAGLAEVYLQVGGYHEAERFSREALGAAEEMGLTGVAALARVHLGGALDGQDRIAEARTALGQALAGDVESQHRRAAALAQILLAGMYGRAGDLEEAERWARGAVAAAGDLRPVLARARATLSRVLLRGGRLAEAIDVGRAAMDTLRELGKADGAEALVRLAWAEALWSAGKMEGACEAISAARDALLTRADAVGEPGWRESFLQVPENATTLAHAEQWLSDDAA